MVRTVLKRTSLLKKEFKVVLGPLRQGIIELRTINKNPPHSP